MQTKSLSWKPTAQPKGPLSGLAHNHKAFGKTLSGNAAHKILRYITLLTKWNRRHSLMANSQDNQLVLKHIVDSLALWPLLAIDGIMQLKKDTKIVDVGSGAGLPGLVLSVVLPNLRVLSVEPMVHKAAFQQCAANQLNLRNFAVCRMAEGLGFSDAKVLVTRAFARTSEAMKVTTCLVPKGPLVVLMKGSYSSLGVKVLIGCAGLWAVSIFRYKIPSLNRRRHVAMVQIRSAMA